MKVAGVEMCGDELWFADPTVRRQRREAVAEAHKEQKILVGQPADEVRRICPQDGRVLGAGGVLRLGGSHLGGYGESDVAYAYRQLSRALHPDKNPDLSMAPAAFHRLSEAAEELRQGLTEQRSVLQRLVVAMGGRATPEMLERPQEALFAEASRLLTAICGLAGEGKVPGPAHSRSVVAFGRSSIYHSSQPQALLSQWFQESNLLELYGTPAMRAAYDCAPKRHRAQMLCLLNRAVIAEAARCGGCVRNPWSAILQSFPELGIWRDFRDQLKQRVWTLDPADLAKMARETELAAAAALGGGEPEEKEKEKEKGGRSRSRKQRKEEKQDRSRSRRGSRNGSRRDSDPRLEPYKERERQRSIEWESRWVKCDDAVQVQEEPAKPDRDLKKAIAENPDTGQRACRWARKWRGALAGILPSGLEGAASSTDAELRKLVAALWKDVVSWAIKGGAGSEAERVLGLFRSDQQTSKLKADAPKDGEESKFEWSFVPASDLILVTGEGLVGITAEGVFADFPGGRRRLTFADCFKRPGEKSRKKAPLPPARSKWDMPAELS